MTIYSQGLAVPKIIPKGQYSHYNILWSAAVKTPSLNLVQTNNNENKLFYSGVNWPMRVDCTSLETGKERTRTAMDKQNSAWYH